MISEANTIQRFHWYILVKPVKSLLEVNEDHANHQVVILSITFRATDSPHIVSSNMQPKYVIFECCFIFMFL